MKSFRQILGEVAQPKSAEERAFKDMHSYETIPHPVALDHQFTGAIGADDLPREKAKRLADQEGDANYDTSYDDAFEYEGPSFAEQVAKNLTDRLSEGSAMAKSAALSKASETSKSGKAKVSLKKAPWDKNEEVDLDEASARDARIAAALGKSPAKKYEIKDNKIHISKANFRKVHKDNKNATKGKERMVALDPKTGGTSSFPVVFTESVELDEGFSPKQIEQLKKAYASMPDRLPVDAAQKMGAILKGRSKEELIAIARADIKWLSTTAATNLIMQGVKAKEING